MPLAKCAENEMVVTPRMILNQSYRRARIASYAGLASLVVVGAVIVALGRPQAYAMSTRHPYLFALLGMGGLALFTGAMTLMARLRCPACGMRLKFLLESAGWRLHPDPRIRCCPYCRQDFDTELPPRDGPPSREE